jgi:hypothetical protein
MANPWDANIKLLYPVDDGTFFTLDVLPLNKDFDVIANVEIGENLFENVDRFELRVSIVNLTTATQVALGEVKDTLTPLNNTQFQAEVRVDFGPIQNSAVGDVLQAVASYKVVAGVNYDVSTAQSVTFVVADAE